MTLWIKIRDILIWKLYLNLKIVINYKYINDGQILEIAQIQKINYNFNKLTPDILLNHFFSFLILYSLVAISYHSSFIMFSKERIKN